jgi:N-acetylmuramoyl-L-alanine amidase
MSFKLRTVTLGVIAFCGALLFSGAADAVTKVSKVRIGLHGDVTRVVVESNKPIKPKHFLLPTPPRVVVDFSNIKFNANVDLTIPKEAHIKKIREGLFKPGVTRMVFDMKRPVTAKVFNLKPNKGGAYRMVLDLKPASQKDIASQKKAYLKRTPKKVIDAAYVAPSKRKKNDGVIVVVDAGHGGVDPGAIGKGKTYEKNITLQVAKKLAAALNKRKNVKAYLTRSTDIYVPLKERVQIAQAKNADIFISLHADAHAKRSVRGGSVYVLSDSASDREAARLARDANRGDLVAGVNMRNESRDVQNILIDLSQRETMNKSALLAQDVLLTMGGVTYLKRNRPSFAGFRVLKAPEIPSILVEMAYLSNVSEEKKLRQGRFQTKLANAIAKGVDKYIKNHRLN